VISEKVITEGWFHETFRRKLGDNPNGQSLMAATILIADDYEDNRELLRLLLTAEHYTILEASNGRDCLKMAQETRPDLILIDLSMPVLDGWAVFQALQADNGTSDIPCVAVTAHADTDRQRALNRGFRAYLTKPFRTAELLETVRQLLKQEAA
jgi:CheY-like chemotaxis protein